MIKVSAVIITYNEEQNIERCLCSLSPVADEIIVVDSFSKDKTTEIAERLGATVYYNEFKGFGSQKCFAISKATNNWVLSLDADEALTPELRQSILEIKQNPEFSVYQVPRLTNYCGKWIWHCGWYPDKQTRIYNRTKGKWVERRVHEFWKLDDDLGRSGYLKGDLLHYSFASINEHLQKIEKYSELAARESVEKGKNTNMFKVYFSPKWHFVNDYFFKLGFLDGFYGYTICRLSAYATFLKYSKIRLYYYQKSKLGKN